MISVFGEAAGGIHTAASSEKPGANNRKLSEGVDLMVVCFGSNGGPRRPFHSFSPPRPLQRTEWRSARAAGWFWRAVFDLLGRSLVGAGAMRNPAPAVAQLTLATASNCERPPSGFLLRAQWSAIRCREIRKPVGRWRGLIDLQRPPSKRGEAWRTVS
jgi:hypothetical protein